MGATSFGNQVSLFGANPNDQKLLVEAWHPPNFNIDTEASKPGAWVTTIRATATTTPGGNLQINPAIALITFGTGGLSQQVRVSLWPEAVIQLPSTTCRIEVMWDPALPQNNGYTLPTQVTIGATLQRSNALTHARYLQWLPRILSSVAAPSPPELTLLPVPAFATAVRSYGSAFFSIGQSADLLWQFMPNGDFESGLQLETLVQNGQEYEFGAGITAVTGNVDLTVFGVPPVGTFTNPGAWALDWRIDL